jgi:hypothetical protein
MVLAVVVTPCATRGAHSMAITIKTDNKWKPFVYRHDVPAKVIASQFAYQNPEEELDGFFKYRGYWYHLDGFMECGGMPELKGWHGYASDSFYSGVVIKISSDGESYMVGTYMS